MARGRHPARARTAHPRCPTRRSGRGGGARNDSACECSTSVRARIAGEPITNVGADGRARGTHARSRGSRPVERALDPLAEPHVPRHARREEIEVVGALEAPLRIRIGIVPEEALDEVGRNAFRVALGRGKPAYGLPSTSASIRSRAPAASSIATGHAAPQATTAACSLPTASNTATASSAAATSVRATSGFVRVGLPEATVIEVDHAAERRQAAVVARDVWLFVAAHRSGG